MLNIRVNGLESAMREAQGAPRQIKFAATRAVNQMAKEAQAEIVEKIVPGDLTVRTNWLRPGTRMGFNLRFANRKENNPTATIKTIAPWVRPQMEGGTRTPHSGKALSLPVEGSMVQPDIKAVIRRAMRPRRLLKRPRFFMFTIKRGATAVAFRPGKKGPRSKNPMQVLYWFEEKVEIKPGLKIEPAFHRLVDKRFTAIWRDAWAYALKTARPPTPTKR